MICNHFSDYPPVPWKEGWRLIAGPDDSATLCTRPVIGMLAPEHADWSFQLVQESEAWLTRVFTDGLSLRSRKRTDSRCIDMICVDSGVFIGRSQGLPAPRLQSDALQTESPSTTWLSHNHKITLLIAENDHFALVVDADSQKQALRKAADAMDLNFDQLAKESADERATTLKLFDVNPMHNPPVALASEALRRRLRNHTPFIKGLWSQAEGFEIETFALNELPALVAAWSIIDPDVAMQLVQTALSLQQGPGGFPAWVDASGASSTVAPWPLIIQTFHHAWSHNGNDPAILKQALPGLRKYIQWAQRYFDPHRDGVPAWQSDQEEFVPGNFDRDKATPALTAMLLSETETLITLCEYNELSQAPTESLAEQRDQLKETLIKIFWNPETKGFSNVWQHGHFTHEPSFESFMPLLSETLDPSYRGPLLERLDSTRGFPEANATDKQADLLSLPAAHQFMALTALQRGDAKKSILLTFARRARESFTTWFQQQSVVAARSSAHDPAPAFHLGPITAALILCSQLEFQHDAARQSPFMRQAKKIFHRLRITKTELIITSVAIAFMLIAHGLYDLPTGHEGKPLLEEARSHYQAGRFQEAIEICQAHPTEPFSMFLRANLLMASGHPEPAVELYHQALRKEIDSPSALFGYALSLQATEQFPAAIKRYNDFIDIYESSLSSLDEEDLIDVAYEFLRLAEAGFSSPPRWRRIFSMPIMNDLGL